MPDSVRVHRKAAQQNAANALGLSAWFERIFAVDVKGLLGSTDYVRESVDPNMVAIMTPSGDRRFIPGVSVPGGPDVLE